MMQTEGSDGTAALALCGDVMTGRGVDQILAHPGDPSLHENYVTSALDYVALAEKASGPIPRRVDPSYIWGDALEVIRRARIDGFVINLETAITLSDAFEPKGINYRMNPANIACLTAARVDCCTLANNHILDWRAAGLHETLRTLSQAKIAVAGAGATKLQARAPALLNTGAGGRILVFAFALPTSGVPADWAARFQKAGVNYLPDLSLTHIKAVAGQVEKIKQPGDIAVASLHWGGNWGYEIPDKQIGFAHALVDDAAIDIVHGHSSHHPKAAEIYKDRPILYGCGDFLNDYEGIGGYEDYRDDLALLYLVTMDGKTGRLTELKLAPFQIRRFRLNRPSDRDVAWLAKRLGREYARFDLAVRPSGDGGFVVRPQ